MKPDVVVDVGNSRIKWGLCRSGNGIELMVSLPGDDPQEWEDQLKDWYLQGHLTWVIAGVQPHWQKAFTTWAEDRGDRCRAFTREHIPIALDVESPETVGLDRLFNALAAGHLKPPNAPAIVVGVGTAVTVDLVREDGSFAGGTIFPGPRLMAESLHRFTAKLPLVNLDEVSPLEAPGKNTVWAITAGISHAITGGALLLAERMAGPKLSRSWVILTGGALGALGDYQFPNVARTVTRPTLTLDGIRIAAEFLT